MAFSSFSTRIQVVLGAVYALCLSNTACNPASPVKQETDADRSFVPPPDIPQGDSDNPATTTKPCDGAASGECSFDARTTYLDSDGVLWEILSAQGQQWTYRQGTQTDNSPADLGSIARYVGGPCKGKPAKGCAFDTLSVYFDADGKKVTSVNAYGKYWFWYDDHDVADGTGALSSVARYAAGACSGKAESDCAFESRTVYFDPSGTMYESITAYGKYWYWVDASSTAGTGSGNTLVSVARYAAGPCKGKSDADCHFDARSVYYDEDGKQHETIIAYGKIWTFLDGAQEASPANGTVLEDDPRY